MLRKLAGSEGKPFGVIRDATDLCPTAGRTGFVEKSYVTLVAEPTGGVQCETGKVHWQPGSGQVNQKSSCLSNLPQLEALDFNERCHDTLPVQSGADAEGARQRC